MKKLVILWTAFMFALCLTGSTLAQEKPGEQGGIRKSVPELSKTDKQEQGKMKEQIGVSAMPSISRIGGVITAVDPKTKTLSVHQETVYHNRTWHLEVTGKMTNELTNLKPGNLVNIWLAGKTVTALQKVG